MISAFPGADCGSLHRAEVVKVHVSRHGEILSISASDIIIHSVSLIIARMVGSAWWRREVRTIVVLVVRFVLMGEDERCAVLVLMNSESSSQ